MLVSGRGQQKPQQCLGRLVRFRASTVFHIMTIMIYGSTNRRNNEESNFWPPAWNITEINVCRQSLQQSSTIFHTFFFYIVLDSHSRLRHWCCLDADPPGAVAFVVMRMSMMWNYASKERVSVNKVRWSFFSIPLVSKIRLNLVQVLNCKLCCRRLQQVRRLGDLRKKKQQCLVESSLTSFLVMPFQSFSL